MRYQLAIFDLDGTILDTLEDLADAINYALKENGYPERTVDEVRSFVGNGIRKLVERAVPGGTSTGEMDRVQEVFNRYYKVHCADKTGPYEGILALLCALRAAGCRTAVVSNKPDYGVQELCGQYFAGMFDFAVGERTGIARKPAPDSVNEVLRVLQVESADAVYIGDSEVDVETAEHARMDHIIVTWGFREKGFLVERGAKRLVDSPEEIRRIILEEKNA